MTLEEQLNKYLSDAHSIEEQALAQMRTAPDIAGDRELSRIFAEHLAETATHEQLVRERMEARGAKPSRIKDALMATGGKGFVLFARLQPDTPGKLVAHAYSYERLEMAAYQLLEKLAERAGDGSTAMTARMIEREERAMAERLSACFDRAAEASVRELDRDDLATQLTKYLSDAHAIEEQAAKLLGTAPKLAGAAALAHALDEHRAETRHHSELVEARLEAHGAGPSTIKDAALRMGALNLGLLFKARPDSPAKLAAFAYAFEHLEIAAYELLKRVASRAGDEATVSAADEILVQERAAAARIHGLLDVALEASLAQSGVTA